MSKEMGRPTLFTPGLGKSICKRITEGESLRSVCRDDDMPCRMSIYNWLLEAVKENASVEHKDFLCQYEIATEIRAEEMFDEMEDIADDGSNDWMDRETKSGNIIEVANTEHIQRSRLRIDTRKWKLSKMFPKIYGDRTTTDLNVKTTHVPKSVEDAAKAAKKAIEEYRNGKG